MTAPLPPIIYGTAWKEAATAELTVRAVLAGFRGLDTANQKKHYREDYVGGALKALKARDIVREDLFLQSKFTYLEGQDSRLPYDPNAPLPAQVEASFTNTLENLHTDYLDAYLLHGPRSPRCLTDDDRTVWTMMENFFRNGRALRIGISNVGLHHLEALCAAAAVKPHIVQNRCFAVTGWDREVREYCLANKIIYQGFSLLTANPQVLFHPQVAAIARRKQVTPMQIVYRFALQIGVLPLTGTSDHQHMKDDLEVVNFRLSDNEIKLIYSLSLKSGFPSAYGKSGLWSKSSICNP